MATLTESARFTPEALRRHWVQVPADNPETVTELTSRLGVDFTTENGRVWETDDFVYLPVVVNIHDGEVVRREAVVFALGDDVLVTLQPHAHFTPFDKAVARLRRQPHLAATPHGIMYALLYALNDAGEQVIDYASTALESMTDEIGLATRGMDTRGRDVGVSEMQATITRINGAEEIVSRCQESQLQMARAARYLRAETPTEDTELCMLIEILTADISGAKEHASFEHNKVRYLQQSIMASLDVKQNQIVKVFTIITAVFLPPTLVATFYGMNFTWMPELAWKHGFLATTLLTLVAALIPLAYIKRKGWLR